jgi:hypothetical protein
MTTSTPKTRDSGQKLSVELNNRQAYERCVLQSNRPPSALRMQELVTAWKLLRKWYGTRSRV